MTLTEERARDAKRRKASLIKTLLALVQGLQNDEGIERVEAISDSDWEQAELQDQGEEDGS